MGARLLTVSLVALAADYAHVPLLTLAGVAIPDTYLGLESYVTVILDIVLGVALVVAATDAAHVELERRNAELRTAQRALHDLAFTDALCGVPNRAAFLDAIVTPPATGTVAMIDLDGLKAINDRFGHAAGDAALEMTARCLRDARGSRGTVYRIGGDEFAAIWDGVAPDAVQDTLDAVARRPRRARRGSRHARARLVGRRGLRRRRLVRRRADRVGRGPLRRTHLPPRLSPPAPHRAGIAISAMTAAARHTATDAAMTARKPAR